MPMNFEALPCVIKNADGIPTYGLLIRPQQTQGLSLEDGRESIEIGRSADPPCTPLDLSSGPTTMGYGDDDGQLRFTNPFFLPAASIERQSSRRDTCSQSSGKSASSFHPFICYPPKGQQNHQHQNAPNTEVSMRDQNFLDDLESTDLSSFLQELSYDPQDLVQLDSATLNASQLELMDSVPSVSFAERLINRSIPSASTNISRSSCNHVQHIARPLTSIDSLLLTRPPAAQQALYPDAATPDSGIQSIGESPRSPPILTHHSPSNQSTVSLAGRLMNPLSVCTGGYDSEWTDSSPVITYPVDATWATNDYNDMPRLERQVITVVERQASPPTSCSNNLTPNVNHDLQSNDLTQNANVDPKTLIDRVLSNLAPSELASVSELVCAKLGNLPKTSVDYPNDEKANRLESSAISAALMAKKLCDYRAKTKQRRQMKRIAADIESLCWRLERLSRSTDDLLTTKEKRRWRFLDLVDWTKVKRCCAADVSGDACPNLEREASDDDNAFGAQTPETSSDWASACGGQWGNSLKLKIRLLRRQKESLTLHLPPTSTAINPNFERSCGVVVCNANLPLKKRFTCQSVTKEQACESSSTCLNSDNESVGGNSHAAEPFEATLAAKRRSKRTRCTSGDCRSVAAPASLQCQSEETDGSSCSSRNIRPPISPGLLRKCRSCGSWLKVAKNAQSLIPRQIKCRRCVSKKESVSSNTQRKEETQSPSFSIRLLPPKKKFVKCGSGHSDYSLSATEVVSRWPPIPLIGQQSPFQLPYDLWWHGVYQKKLLCKDPSLNYKRIRNNVYVDAKLAPQLPCQPCNCKVTRTSDGREICGDSCLNRMMLTECTLCVCPCGDLCSNRRFQKRRWATGLEKFWTGPGKGFGVRTTRFIKASTFVCEYVGELVSPDTFGERMRTWYRQCKRHFALTVDSGTVIDGYRCGSVARFINHSCTPNCHVQIWLVGGQFRVGIFASQDIKPGDELTYDYNFQSFGDSTVEKCLCLSENCTGAVGLAKSAKQNPSDFAFTLRSFVRAELVRSGLSPEDERSLGRKRRLWLARNLRPLNRKMRRKPATPDQLRKRVVLLLRLIVEGLESADSADVNLPRLCRKVKSSLDKDVEAFCLLTSADVTKLLRLTLSCASLCSPERAAAEALTRLQPGGDADGNDGGSEAPLVGAYDPDDGVALWRRAVAAPDLPPAGADKVRCVCGAFEEDGTMVQCDGCSFWLHSDCLPCGEAIGDVSPFACEFCRLLRDAPLRRALRDVPLRPPPDLRLPGCVYFRAMMCRDLFQIRIGDCVYVKRNVDERHRRLLSTLNDHNATGDAQADSLQSILDSRRRFYRRDQLRIMRVERLFVTSKGFRFVFGNYFAHHYETFCEPSRRFYENEVFVTPLYDTWPLEAVVGRCLVLDPATFCAGRPTVWHFDPKDVFVCEYRVDKAQRLFDKSSAARFRHSLNANAHYFRRFDQKLTIRRNYTPFTDHLTTKSVDPFDADALTDQDICAFTALYKTANLLKLVQQMSPSDSAAGSL